MKKKKLVVLTGAGISAESGLKTFRDSDGLWEGHRVEDVATPRAWAKDPQLVLHFYNERRKNAREAQPNAAHKGLAALEKQFDVKIITQNIDDLHERGGSSSVLHLHGSIFQMCSEKDRSHITEIYEDMEYGSLAPDGSCFRPNIVWFEEPVPAIEAAINEVITADIFVVIGTSLVVYPAAGLLNYVPRGKPVVIIDKKIPAVSIPSIHVIEKPATEGINDLVELLHTF